jgi:sulfur carrier protein
MAQIKVNDETQEVALPATLTDLIRLNNAVPDMVSVQLNGVLIPREDLDTTGVSEGDEVDFLFFMGGGR